ncbi:MAG: sulfatase [Bacteroidota bacterium]
MWNYYRTKFKWSIKFAGILFVLGCDSDNTQNDIIEKDHPNIVLFVSDDHGLDALGCYGNKVIKTPNMDKLAAEGIRFDNAYCTSASCAASRSVILTGKYGHATGSYGHTHDYHHFSTFENVLSLPGRLSEVGYSTARIGKYHLAPESVYNFDIVLEENERSVAKMVQKCEQVVASDKPFFLYFCTGDPHRGAPFKPKNWNEPNNFGNRKEGYDGVKEITYSPEEVVVPPFIPDNPETRAELAQYYQSVSRVDTGLGDLFQLLDESGKAENTIVIYISDNGIAFPGAKTTVYEPGIKLPCIIKNPLMDVHGEARKAFISWVDLAPTILDMASVAYDDADFHGSSFHDVFYDDDPDRNEVFASHIFHEITMYYPMRSVRQGDHKLIWNMAYQLPYPFASDLWSSSTWQSVHRNNIEFYGKRNTHDFLFRDEFELYDLSKDPLEVVNLANEPSYTVQFQDLQKAMKQFQKRTKDPWFILWDHDASMQGTGVGL